MKRLTTEKGHIAYKTSLAEVLSWGGLGICDSCNEFHPEGGYVVPVLNWWMCEKCFKEWITRAIHYPEDDQYERQVASYYEKILKVE